jgi:tetratricopeptide (TPR) repeat protein
MNTAQKIHPPFQFNFTGHENLFTGLANIGNRVKGRNALQKASNEVQSIINSNRKSSDLYSTLAYAEAHLGNKKTALDAINKAIMLWKLHPVLNFNEVGGLYVEHKAEILAHFKEADKTASHLDKLFQTPGKGLAISQALLRIYSIWDLIRNTPAFQNLHKKYPMRPQA